MSVPKTVERYLRKHARIPPEAGDLPPPAPDLGLCVVIPCLAEGAGLTGVLDSLGAGSVRCSQAEVIVVVNSPLDPDPVILADNLATLQLLQGRVGGLLAVHVVDRASPGRQLPPAEAGVGLARRIGMDLALSRLARAEHPQRTAIACLDGDSPVDPGYLDVLLGVFDDSDPPLGAICSCLHPIPDDPDRAAAIVAYELWMRYFEAGMRAAGSPFSYPTVGSCLVASAAGYAAADGMPERQAGEDFYFAQKLIKASGRRPLARLSKAVVRPAARLSTRVPFGTGRALVRWLEEGPDSYRMVEPPGAFFELGRFFAALEAGYRDPDRLVQAACTRLAGFLEADRGWRAIDRIRSNQPDPARFSLAVHHWFDGLRCVRYAHLCERDEGRVWAFDAIGQVLDAVGENAALVGLETPRPPDPPLGIQVQWLERLRALG